MRHARRIRGQTSRNGSARTVRGFESFSSALKRRVVLAGPNFLHIDGMKRIGTGELRNNLMNIRTCVSAIWLTVATAASGWAQTAGPPNNETFKALLDAARKDLRTEKQS